MRKRLKERVGQRLEFTGVFDRLGSKPGYMGGVRTVLLREVRFKRDGTPATDHLWFSLTKGFDDLGLSPGEKVEFTARVRRYLKGYLGQRHGDVKPPEVDYRLAHPSQLRRAGVDLADDGIYQKRRASRIKREAAAAREEKTRFRREDGAWWVVGRNLSPGLEVEVTRSGGSVARVIIGEVAEVYKNGKIRAAFVNVPPQQESACLD